VLQRDRAVVAFPFVGHSLLDGSRESSGGAVLKPKGWPRRSSQRFADYNGVLSLVEAKL